MKKPLEYRSCLMNSKSTRTILLATLFSFTTFTSGYAKADKVDVSLSDLIDSIVDSSKSSGTESNSAVNDTGLSLGSGKNFGGGGNNGNGNGNNSNNSKSNNNNNGNGNNRPNNGNNGNFFGNNNNSNGLRPISTGYLGSSLRRSSSGMPEDYDCPLFSNNPYGDILSALDSLGSNIMANDCIDDKLKDQSAQMSTNLIQQIIDAQNNDQQGSTRKLGLNAQTIISSASQLQNLLGQFVNYQKDTCYKDKKPKKLIFAINDVLQSYSPLVLDFVAKNPGLSMMLKNYMPLVLGAQAISGSVATLESAINSLKTLNINDLETQIMIVKNTCSFVKVYSRFEILLLENSELKDRIEKDFNSKIQKNNEKIKMMSSNVDRGPIPTNSAASEFLETVENAESSMQILTRAQIESKTASISDPIASQGKVCSIVRTAFKNIDADQLMDDFDQFSKLLRKQGNNKFTLDRFEGLNDEFSKIKDPKTSVEYNDCAELAKNWVESALEVSTELTNMLAQYSQKNQSVIATVGTNGTSTGNTNSNTEVSKIQKENQNLEDNKKKLGVFINYTTFEPSIIAKRIGQMPKYLFNGPDSNPKNALVGLFNKVANNGPVYDFLKNNEEHFKMKLDDIKSNISKLQSFEMQVLDKEFPKGPKGGSVEIKNYLTKMDLYKKTFPHLDKRYLSAAPVAYKNVCDQVNLVRKNYAEAIQHLISSDGMCKMIDPILKEKDVSMWLKRYCRDANGLVTNKEVAAGYKVMAKPLFGTEGLKTYVDNINKKLDTLGCE